MQKIFHVQFLAGYCGTYLFQYAFPGETGGLVRVSDGYTLQASAQYDSNGVELSIGGSFPFLNVKAMSCQGCGAIQYSQCAGFTTPLPQDATTEAPGTAASNRCFFNSHHFLHILAGGFVCPAPNGDYTSPYFSCSSNPAAYVQCVNYVATETSCTGGLLWNPTSLQCDSVGCGTSY